MPNPLRPETHVLATSLAMDECVRRLGARIAAQSFWRRHIDGTVDRDGFEIWRRRGRNSFVPTARGRFVPAQAGTRIEVQFGRIGLVLGIAFLVTIVAVLLFALPAAGASPLSLPFVPLVVLGGGFAAALALSQQWRPGGDRHELLALLCATLEAREVSDSALR